MAIEITQQYRYSGRGPLDSKTLVKTFTDLLNEATWETENKKLAAYNGMIVAVWLDGEKNGIYYLHDPAVTSIFKAPDVTNEANWHRLGGIDNLPGLAEQVASIQAELENLQNDVNNLQDSATEVVDTFGQLPNPGAPGKLYIVTKDATTYIWHNGSYLPVGDGAEEADIQIINGGSASST